MSVELGAGFPKAVDRPVAPAVRAGHPAAARHDVAGPLLGCVAVVLTTSLAVLVSSGASAAMIPAVAIAAIAWLAALHHIGGPFPALTIGTPLTSAVAGVLALAVASVAAALLPGMDVLDRSELLLLAVVIGTISSLYACVQRQVGPRRRVLVVGAGSGGAELVGELRAHGELPFDCVGVVDDVDGGISGGAVIGTIDDLPAVIERERPDLIVLAGIESARAIEGIFSAPPLGFRLVELNHFYEHAFGRVPLPSLTPAWFVGLLDLYRRSYSRVSKRAFDLVITAIGLVPVALLMPLVALLVRCSGRGPILFKQVRLGECGKLFEIYKFRTMVVDAERMGVPVWATAHDPRITRIGRLLRRTRLDELPQLWNVLRGDMSIVGPRPERPEFLELLSSEVPFWERRHLVKPGITGWAQVRCGYTDDSLGAAEKLSYDLYYLKHRSLLLDVAITAKTAGIVLRGTGAH